MSHLSYMEKLLDGVDVNWEPLDKVFNIYAGGDVPKDALSDIETEEFNIPILSNGIGDKSLYGWTNQAKIEKPSLTISARGTIGWTSYRNRPFFPIVRLLVLTPKVELNLKYAYYFMKMIENNYKVAPAGIPQLTKPMLKNILIPIPCPNNPEKSLAIQAEIVRILDGFNALIAELTTELNMRKKQYSHYQFELLKFTETTQQISIGECCDIKKGATPIKKATPGKFPLVATTEERQSSSEYQFDCPAVCVPLISSRGHGVASIDRIYYQDGKFALGNILCAITPNDSEVLSAKFLRYYLFDKKDVLLVPLMRGGANVSLTMDSLKKVKIPIPPIADQQRIVCALDKFDEFVKALPCEIELRQKQYEYYRDLLLSFPQSHSDETA